jgi:hypothetical protein
MATVPLLFVYVLVARLSGSAVDASSDAIPPGSRPAHFPVQYVASVAAGATAGWGAAPDTLTWTYLDANKTDDSPLSRIELPGGFPFYGKVKRHAQVSGNGGVHFDAYPPCGCCFVSSGGNGVESCNFNTSYDNMLAPYITDFIPAASVNSSIATATLQNPARVLIRFKGIPLFGVTEPPHAPLYTFGVVLYTGTGRLRFVYEHVVLPEQLRNLRNLTVAVPEHINERWSMLVGVRPPVPSQLVNTGKALIGHRSIANNSKVLMGIPTASPPFAAFPAPWGARGAAAELAAMGAVTTTTEGAYPSTRDWVKGDTSIDFCPMPTEWCAFPTAGIANGGTDVTLTGLSMGCFEDAVAGAPQLDFWCVFGSFTNVSLGVAVKATPRFDAAAKADAMNQWELRCKSPAWSDVAAAADPTRTTRTVRVSVLYSHGGLSPRTGTMFTGESINFGTPVAMSLSYDLGNNEWLVGVMDAAYLKMSKITITGASSYTWIATKLTGSPTAACKVQATFNEACFVGTDTPSESYPLTLVAIATPIGSSSGPSESISPDDAALTPLRMNDLLNFTYSGGTGTTAATAATAAAVAAAAAAASCSSPFASAAAQQCDSCGVCGGETTCTSAAAGGVCAAKSVIGVVSWRAPRVFDYPDCAGDCTHKSMMDTTGKCCPVASQDCFGTCNGTGRLSTGMWTSSNTEVVMGVFCCETQLTDCDGVCNGRARPDLCGYCTGGTTGIEANAFRNCDGTCRAHNETATAVVYENGTDGGGKPQYVKCEAKVEAEPTSVSAVLQAATGRQVHTVTKSVAFLNTGKAAVFICSFQVNPAQEYGASPSIFLLNHNGTTTGVDVPLPKDCDEATLPPGTALRLYFRITIAQALFYSGSAWRAKISSGLQLQASYMSVTKAGLKPGAIAVPLDVRVSDCENVTDMHICTALPSCFFCLDSPAMDVSRK